MSELKLGVAGSNTFRPSRQVRLACATDRWNEKTRHIIVKRRADAHGAGGRQTYLADADLQRRLQEWADAHGYPNPEGKGTSRAPIVLLSNDPDNIVQQAREMRIGAQLLCECAEWTLKDPSLARKERLPWPCEDLDDERYYIGTATWHNYRDETRSMDGKSWTVHVAEGTEPRVCNPAQCPYATGADPRIKQACRPVTEIQCMLGEWGGNEPAIIHAQSKSTARRFASSLAIVLREVRAVAGIEIDLVLDWTEPLTMPGGGKARQPYWAVAIPYGLTPEQFRARAIESARRIVEDNQTIMELAALQQKMLAVSKTDWHRGGLLSEFDPQALPAGTPEPETGPLDIAEQQAIADLVARGVPEPQAEAMVRANADDLPGLFDSLGDTDGAAEETPVIEGEFTTEDEPEPELFVGGVAPDSIDGIKARFDELGMEDGWLVVIGNATKTVLGRARKTVPKPSDLESPEQELQLYGETLRFALLWWERHQGQGAAA